MDPMMTICLPKMSDLYDYRDRSATRFTRARS